MARSMWQEQATEWGRRVWKLEQTSVQPILFEGGREAGASPDCIVHNCSQRSSMITTTKTVTEPVLGKEANSCVTSGAW